MVIKGFKVVGFLLYKTDQFASRSRRCVFVGYPQGKKGWKLYDLDRHEIFVSRDVKFYEEQFPFIERSVMSGSSGERTVGSHEVVESESDGGALWEEEETELGSPMGEAVGAPNGPTDALEGEEDPGNCEGKDSLDSIGHAGTPESASTPELGRGHRSKKPSVL